MKDSKSLMLNVSTMNDINNICKNTKYININVSKPNKKVFSYFIKNGKDYMYSDMIDGNAGYIYVDYDTFFKAEAMIEKILSSVNNNFSDVEKLKYVYICIGNILGYDINIMPEKNESFSFSRVSIINNIWGAIYYGKATNIAITKIIYYICSLLKIDCDIVNVNDVGYLKNKVLIDNNYLIVDLMKDLPFIQSKFKTRYFASFNDDMALDKKIKYIKDDYNESKVDMVLKRINVDSELFLEEILISIQSIINIGNIKPYELSYIMKYIFDKYYPNYDVVINNLYINNINMKEHFILISYDGKHYSFNFTVNSFIAVTDNNLIDNIESNKIGLYLGEIIPNANMYKKEVV